MIQQDRSYGVIPLRRQNGSWEVFLIQHCHGYHWGFPKGHAESGELPEDSARRELKEETNLDVVCYLQKEPLVEQYQFVFNKKHISKSVYYFLAEVSGETILQTKEISDGKWLSIQHAFEQLTHLEGRQILAQVEKILTTI